MKARLFCLTTLILFAGLLLLPLSPTDAAAIADRLRGRILLQVESVGEAWYVHPDTFERHYMRDGDVAYQLMRDFGLGITDADLLKIPVGVEPRFEDLDSDQDGLADKLEKGLKTDPYSPDTDEDGLSDYREQIELNTNPLGPGRLSYSTVLRERLQGKILLQVESRGEAWYVHPEDQKRYYMKDGPAAYQIMRFLSLGITNRDLATIPTASSTNSPIAPPFAPTTPTPSVDPPLSETELKTLVGPKVVVVETSTSQGTGFFVDGNHVLTNAHVVKGQSLAQISTTEEQAYAAEVVGRDEPNDLAVLRITSSHPAFSPIPIGDSTNLQEGEGVCALGYPVGLGTNILRGINPNQTCGFFTSRQHLDHEYLVHDVNISSGNSGGPLVNKRGQVVGVNSFVVTPAAGAGLNFAIPSSRVLVLLPDLKNGRTIYSDIAGTPTQAPTPTVPADDPDAQKFRDFDSSVDRIVSENSEAIEKYKRGVAVLSSIDLALPYFEDCEDIAIANVNRGKVLPQLWKPPTSDYRNQLILLTQTMVTICETGKTLVLASGTLYETTYAQHKQAIHNYSIYATAADNMRADVNARARALGYIN